MDEALIKQLTRQLRLLNIWITFFGIMFLVGFIVIGVLIYKVVTLTHDVSNKFDSVQQKTEQTLNLQKQIHL
jgi:predicted PurR-regulated permease PerM